MRDDQVQFLLAEYEAAWAHIREIDQRRFRLLEFYISLNAILVAALAAFVARQATVVTRLNLLTVVAAAGIAIVGGVVICGMLCSERQANVRFRKRVNYIRGTFLDRRWKDTRTAGYLCRWKELNTQTDKQNGQLRLVGKTLTFVYTFFGVGMAVWLAAAITALVMNSYLK